MNTKFTALFLGFMLLAFSVSGCATSGFNQGQFNMISIEEEKKLGGEYKAEVDNELHAQGKYYQDSLVTPYVNGLGRRLLASAPEVKFAYTFSVVNTKVVNAFAVPGGHIYIHTGLIAEARNEAELAGVISHEIGHVVARHGSERLSAILAATLVGQILVGAQEDEIDRLLTQLAVQLVTTGGMLAYSRANENEADRIGADIMYRAGYDPRAMVGFFERLHDKKGDMSRFEVFISTHPDPRDRQARVKDYISGMPLGENLIENSPEFQQVQAHCQALHPESEEG